MNWVASSAPRTLSDAIWHSISVPLTARSTAITLTPLDLANSTAPVTASESTGLTIRTEMPEATRSSMSEVCFAASSPASATVSFTPAASAAFCAPSTRVTKKGLFWVETARPMEPSPTTAVASSSSAKVSTLSMVTRVTSTGMDFSISSPLISFSALETAVEPIRAGCCAMVPAI